MAKKKAKKKSGYPLYIQASNPDQSVFNFVRNMTKIRTVYFQTGKPVNPPPCPQGGCQ